MLKPLRDRVLVRRAETKMMTESGIYIPENVKEKPRDGEVVATGTGIKCDDGSITPLTVKVGDRILFGEYSGQEIVVNGEDLLIIPESDILGVVA